MIQAVIFDLDGVIVDSEKFSFKAYEHTFQKKGIHLDDDDRKNTIGHGTHENIVAIKKKYGLKFDDNELISKKKEMYKKLSRGKLLVFPGAQELIKNLRQKVKIAIASSGDRDKIDFTLKQSGMDNIFETIVDSTMITKSKPDPEIFTKTAQALEIPAKECIVIEDSIQGIKAAKAAGMKCIAVTNTFSAEDLIEADLIINSLANINVERILSL